MEVLVKVVEEGEEEEERRAVLCRHISPKFSVLRLKPISVLFLTCPPPAPLHTFASDDCDSCE